MSLWLSNFLICAGLATGWIFIIRMIFYFLNRRSIKQNALCPWNPDSHICECMEIRKETSEDHANRDSSI